MKKVKILWLVLIITFILFLSFLLVPRNYCKTYTINKIKIDESYNKDFKGYYFTLEYNKIKFDVLLESKYFTKRGLIENIKIKTDDNLNYCLLVKSKKLEFKPLCYDDEKIINYKLINKELKRKLPKYLFKEEDFKEYQDIKIYNNKYTYLLWNYDGFYYLNNKIKKKIKIFNKEFYNISLIGYTNDYLVVADYTNSYTFNNIYTIDYKKGNLKKHKIDRNIYIDSYYIGYQKNKLYIVDNKEMTMYEFDAKKGKIEKIKSKFFENEKWKQVNIKTLINKKREFKYQNNYNYQLKDNKIYLSYHNKKIKTLIDVDVKSIVRVKGKDIFYIKDASLYHYNPLIGEEKLLNYFEWNFNYDNMIYID